MVIHTISCISDNFTEDEIKKTERFVTKKLTKVMPLLRIQGGDIVLYLKSDIVIFNPIGFTPSVKSIIENLLRN